MKPEVITRQHKPLMRPILERMGDHEDWFEDMLEKNRTARKPLFLFFRGDDERPWGYLGAIVNENDTAWIEGGVEQTAINAWRTVKVLRLYADYCFKAGIHKLKAVTRLDNTPAELILRAAGFRKEGLSLSEIKQPDGSYADGITFALLEPWLKKPVSTKLVMEQLRRQKA